MILATTAPFINITIKHYDQIGKMMVFFTEYAKGNLNGLIQRLPNIGSIPNKNTHTIPLISRMIKIQPKSQEITNYSVYLDSASKTLG